MFMSSNIAISYSYLNVSTKLGAAHCFIKSLHTMEPNNAVMFIDFKQLTELRKIRNQVVDIQRLAIIGCLNIIRTKAMLTMYVIIPSGGRVVMWCSKICCVLCTSLAFVQK